MKKLLPIIISILVVASLIGGWNFFKKINPGTGAPPYNVADDFGIVPDPYAWIRDWKRPDGPPKVALQVGHWKNSEFPDELEKLPVLTIENPIVPKTTSTINIIGSNFIDLL